MKFCVLINATSLGRILVTNVDLTTRYRAYLINMQIVYLGLSIGYRQYCICILVSISDLKYRSYQNNYFRKDLFRCGLHSGYRVNVTILSAINNCSITRLCQYHQKLCTWKYKIVGRLFVVVFIPKTIIKESERRNYLKWQFLLCLCEVLGWSDVQKLIQNECLSTCILHTNINGVVDAVEKTPLWFFKHLHRTSLFLWTLL